MTFRYFAYGSNMLTSRMQARCPSARIIGTAVLAGWRAVYDKPSVDGSAKLNIRANEAGVVVGVVYEIEDAERDGLAAVEQGYTPIDTSVGLAYAYEGQASSSLPYDWYVAMVEEGAYAHGIRSPERPNRPQVADGP